MSIERQFHVFAKAVEEMRQAQKVPTRDIISADRAKKEVRVDRLLRKLLHPMDSD